MLSVTLYSSLEKLLLGRRVEAPSLGGMSCLGGEEFAFQAVLQADGWGMAPVRVAVDSPLKDCIQVFQVGQVPCALPAYPGRGDENYLTTQPGLFPDPLLPLEEGRVEVSSFFPTALWVNGKVPQGFPAGEYPITLRLEQGGDRVERTFSLRVLGVDLPPQRLIYTQWLHGDCLATYYGVPVYSEEHWQLWEKYLAAASEEGMNMVLTPIFTPPLDTEPGTERPCVQLVGVEKTGESYRFDFSLLERFLQMARRCGVERFEMAHLFTQWGAQAAPAIYGREEGVRRRLFGWDTPAASPEYAGFLRQLLPALTAFLRRAWRARRCSTSPMSPLRNIWIPTAGPRSWSSPTWGTSPCTTPSLTRRTTTAAWWTTLWLPQTTSPPFWSARSPGCGPTTAAVRGWMWATGSWPCPPPATASWAGSCTNTGFPVFSTGGTTSGTAKIPAKGWTPGVSRTAAGPFPAGTPSPCTRGRRGPSSPCG